MLLAESAALRRVFASCHARTRGNERRVHKARSRGAFRQRSTYVAGNRPRRAVGMSYSSQRLRNLRRRLRHRERYKPDGMAGR